MIKLGFSLSVMAIGLLVVFFGLVVLIFATKGMSKLLQKAQKKEQPVTKAAQAPKPVAAPAPVVEEPSDDPQLIAVITAAIMAMEGASGNLVVRRVSRAGNAWARTGRGEILSSR
ncbi:MAG: OadG family protein [Clostridia bacterium]|nr:OadG family protein [Clostridia bacterium]